MQICNNVWCKGIQNSNLGAKFFGNDLSAAWIKLWLYEYDLNFCCLGHGKEADQFIRGWVVTPNLNRNLLKVIFIGEVSKCRMENKKLSSTKGLEFAFNLFVGLIELCLGSLEIFCKLSSLIGYCRGK